ncbi:hypothetical protein Tco_1037076 [Tanacetum coccineum]
MTDNLTKAQCKHCFHFLSSGSNSTLRNHITYPHCEALKMVPEAGQSSMAQDKSVFLYNLDAVREQFMGEAKKPCLSPNWDVLTRWNSTYHMFQCGSKQKGVELLIELITVDWECFDDRFATKAKEWFIGYFQGLYNHYYLKYGNPTTQSTSVTSSSTQSADRIKNTSSLEHSLDFEEDVLEAEVQDNEAIPLSDEEIALDEAASEAMSNGSGSG